MEAEGESFRGYIPSKRRYFYGLRVHLVVSGKGEPVEFSLTAGSEAEVKVFKDLSLDLPEGWTIHADKGYTDYDHEDFLKEELGLHLKAQRKKNSEGPMPMWEEFLGKPIRQYIETVFGKLSELFARSMTLKDLADISRVDYTRIIDMERAKYKKIDAAFLEAGRGGFSHPSSTVV